MLLSRRSLVKVFVSCFQRRLKGKSVVGREELLRLLRNAGRDRVFRLGKCDWCSGHAAEQRRKNNGNQGYSVEKALFVSPEVPVPILIIEFHFCLARAVKFTLIGAHATS